MGDVIDLFGQKRSKVTTESELDDDLFELIREANRKNKERVAAERAVNNNSLIRSQRMKSKDK